MIDRKNSYNEMARETNLPVDKKIRYLYILGTYILSIIYLILPCFIIYILNGKVIKSRADFSYIYSFGFFEAPKESIKVISGLIYVLCSLSLFAITSTWITILLENKVVWSRPAEFPLYKKVFEPVKKILPIFLIVACFLIYLAANTYVLIGDNGILYRPPTALKSKVYNWIDVKNVTFHYFKSKSRGGKKYPRYYLLLQDNTIVRINLPAARFISEKTGLRIIDDKELSFEVR